MHPELRNRDGISFDPIRVLNNQHADPYADFSEKYLIIVEWYLRWLEAPFIFAPKNLQGFLNRQDRHGHDFTSWSDELRSDCCRIIECIFNLKSLSTVNIFNLFPFALTPASELDQYTAFLHLLELIGYSSLEHLKPLKHKIALLTIAS